MIVIATLDAIRPCLDLRLIFMVHLPPIRAYHSRFGAAASGLANEKQVRKEPAYQLIRSVSHRHSNFFDKCHTYSSAFECSNANRWMTMDMKQHLITKTPFEQHLIRSVHDVKYYYAKMLCSTTLDWLPVAGSTAAEQLTSHSAEP